MGLGVGVGVWGEGNLVKKILETFKTHMDVGGRGAWSGVKWGRRA